MFKYLKKLNLDYNSHINLAENDTSPVLHPLGNVYAFPLVKKQPLGLSQV